MAAASRCPTSGTRPTSDTSSTGMENSESSRTSSSGDTEEKSWRENPWSLSHNAREILFFQNFVAEMGFLNRKEVIEKNDLIISPRA